MTSKRNNIVSHRGMEKNDLKEPARELSQFDNKKPEELESEFDQFDLDNSYPTCINSYHLMGINIATPHYPRRVGGGGI